MSDPENQNQPLMRATSQQTGVDVEAPGQSARSSRAYKVTGLTLLACVLIVGQATITYLVLSQRSDIKSLEDQNEKLRMDLTKTRTFSVPLRVQTPMNPMLQVTDDALEEESSTGAPEKSLDTLTDCELEAAGLKPVPVPLFRPSCNNLGLYRAQQCFAGECWCVKPETGEQIPGSLRRGKATCRSTGMFSPSLLLTE